MPKRRTNGNANFGKAGDAGDAAQLSRTAQQNQDRLASLIAACDANGGAKREWFTWFAQTVARYAGKPGTFLLALVLIIVWAFSGPLFGFSDTWQLVVNTATTIVTFLMVFLIQNTQNRDTLALQVKLAELIIAMQGTHNNMAIAEDLSDEDLEALHEEYRKRAEQTEDSLERRRSGHSG